MRTLLGIAGCWFPEVQWPDPWHRPRSEFSVTTQPMRDWFHPENETNGTPKKLGLWSGRCWNSNSDFRIRGSIFHLDHLGVCSAVPICGHRNDTCFIMLFFLCFSDFMWALMWGLNWGGSLGIFLPPGMTAGSKYPCPMAGFEGRPIRQAERELMRLKEHGGMAMMAAVGWFPELFQFWDTLGIRDTPEFQDVSSVSNPDPNRSGHFCFEPLHVGVHGEQTCSTGSLGASFYLSLSAAKTMAKIWPKITEVLGHLELLSLSWYLERILWYTIHTHIITYIYI